MELKITIETTELTEQFEMDSGLWHLIETTLDDFYGCGDYEITDWDCDDIDDELVSLCNDLEDLNHLANWLESKRNPDRYQEAFNIYLENVGVGSTSIEDLTDGFDNDFFGFYDDLQEVLDVLDDRAYKAITINNLQNYVDFEEYIDNEIMPNSEFIYYWLDDEKVYMVALI